MPVDLLNAKFLQRYPTTNNQIVYCDLDSGNDANSGASYAAAKKNPRAAAAVLNGVGGTVKCKGRGPVGNQHFGGINGVSNSNYIRVIVDDAFCKLNNADEVRDKTAGRPWVQQFNSHVVQLNGCHHVVIFGFEISGNQAASVDAFYQNGVEVASAYRCAVWACHVHNIYQGGIAGNGTFSPLENIDIAYNCVHDTANSLSSSASAITLYQSSSQGVGGGPDQYGVGEYIIGNWGYNSADLYGANTDGEFIIMDVGRNTGYAWKYMMANNIAVNNGGHGIHGFNSDQCHEMFNTACENTWHTNNQFGEFSHVSSNNGSCKYNVAMTRTDRTVWHASYDENNTPVNNVVLRGSSPSIAPNNTDKTAVGPSYFTGYSTSFASGVGGFKPTAAQVVRFTPTQNERDMLSWWPDAAWEMRPATSWAAGALEPTTSPSAPVANFTFSPSVPTTGQSVQFTDTSSNTPTSWSWNFGDGGTSTAQNPTHTYANAGSYTVSLTVTNSIGNNTTTKTVSVSAPGATNCVQGETGTLAQNTGGVAPTVSSDNPGFNGSGYVGNWGGNTSTVTLTYNAPSAGTYNIVMRYRSYSGGNNVASCSRALKIGAGGTPQTYSLPHTTTVGWNDANGFKTSEAHQYTLVSGANTIIITHPGPDFDNWIDLDEVCFTLVTGGGGGGGTAPVSQFTWSPNQPSINDVVQFTDQSAASPTSWSWDFGDGSAVSTSQNPTHQYTADGVYVVKLTATNANGSNVSQQSITVSTAQVSQIVVSGDSPTVNGTWLTSKWWLKDPFDHTSNYAFEIVGDSINLTSHEEMAIYSPVGRDRPVSVSDVVTGDEGTIEIEFSSVADLNAFKKLRNKRRTLLLQSSWLGRQWYVKLESDATEKILNTNPYYATMKVQFTEVEDPHSEGITLS